MHKIRGAYLCVSNNNAKLKSKEMKTCRVADYTNQTPLNISDGKNVLFQHPSKIRNILSNGTEKSLGGPSLKFVAVMVFKISLLQNCITNLQRGITPHREIIQIFFLKKVLQACIILCQEIFSIQRQSTNKWP